MKLPIVAYGHPTLRKPTMEIGPDYPELKELVADMFETMHSSDGVGLAAPQVNRSIRLFIVDAAHYADEQPDLKDFRRVFINARIVEESGEEWEFNEGCLSIPQIREDVSRMPRIRIQYYDEDFNFHDEVFEGIGARIVQHEYDHVEGILFVDRINPLRKVLLKKKLTDIANGNIDVGYKMIFPGKKKKVRV